jgi:hypothetical protein
VGAVKQWGEWLRVSSRKSKKPPPPVRPSMSASSFSSRSSSEFRHNAGVSIRDIPPRRNLAFDNTFSSSSRTGGNEMRRGDGDVSSQDKVGQERIRNHELGKNQVVESPPKRKSGTYVRRQRKDDGVRTGDNLGVPPNTKSKKRGKRQV